MVQNPDDVIHFLSQPSKGGKDWILLRLWRLPIQLTDRLNYGDSRGGLLATIGSWHLRNLANDSFAR